MENRISKYNQIMLENEREVNKLMADLGKKLIWLIPVMVVLWLVGILSVGIPQLIGIVTIAAVAFLMPVVSPNIAAKEQHIKWIIILTYVIAVTAVFATIYVNALIYWIIPITIAALYYDIRLIIGSVIAVIPGMVIGEIVASNAQYEFIPAYEWIPLHMGMYLSGIIVLLCIMIALAKRTYKMLERSYNLTDKVQGYLERNLETSQIVGDSIGIVNQTIMETHNVIECVGESIENIATSSNDIISVAHETENIV